VINFTGLVLFVGAAALGRSLWQWRAARRLHEVGTAVMGVVTDVRSRWKRSGDDSYRVYQVVLRFETADGRTVETESSEGSTRSPRAEVGESVPIVYDPDDPQRARIEGISGGEIFTWAMTGGVGAVFLLLGLTGLFA
jgi:uncharacterized protein DUF3592